MTDHPCETCLRWPECNGIDRDTCQLVKAHDERESAPTEMAEFLANRLQVPVVHITAEEMDRLMKHGARIRGRIIV